MNANTRTHLFVDELHDLVVKQQPATSRLDHRHVVPMVGTTTDVYNNGEKPALFRFRFRNGRIFSNKKPVTVSEGKPR